MRAVLVLGNPDDEHLMKRIGGYYGPTPSPARSFDDAYAKITAAVGAQGGDDAGPCRPRRG